MIGAILSFSSMAVAGRELASELDTFELMMYRSFIGIVIVLTASAAFGTLGQITTRSLGLHFARNLSHFIGQNLWFFALPLIPLAQVFAFEFTSPIWVILLAPLFLGERLTALRILVAMIGFLGVLMVSRPVVSEISPGLIAAALAAVGFAATTIFTKQLTRTETVTCIIFYLTLMQACLGILTAGYDGEIALPSSAALPWVIVIGITGLLAHFCITTALTLAPAVFVVPIDFARLPIIMVIGATLYGEVVDVWVILGAAVIFGANYLNIWAERPHARLSAPDCDAATMTRRKELTQHSAPA